MRLDLLKARQGAGFSRKFEYTITEFRWLGNLLLEIPQDYRTQLFGKHQRRRGRIGQKLENSPTGYFGSKVDVIPYIPKGKKNEGWAFVQADLSKVVKKIKSQERETNTVQHNSRQTPKPQHTSKARGAILVAGGGVCTERFLKEEGDRKKRNCKAKWKVQFTPSATQ